MAEQAKSAAADRMQKLRWMLTLLFTVINGVGLIIFAWVAISNDQARGEEKMNGDVTTVTSIVDRLVSTGGTGLDTGSVSTDPLNTTCPQFVILPGGVGQFAPYASAQKCVQVNLDLLGGFAHDAATSGHVLSGYTSSATGQLLWMRAEPFRNQDGQYIGATVAVENAEPQESAHDQFVLFAVLGCVLLVSALGAGGYFLANRAIRPAATALEQQEILLAETAHDLRTPVAALRALAETAMRNPGQTAELLPRTVNLAARMGGIIDSLLVRARLAAGVGQLDIQPVWLDQLVAGLVEDTPTEGASVTVTVAPSLVHVDPGLVQRAAGNLLDNALRYGRKADELPVVHITVTNGRVIVADHGPGVDSTVAEDKLDRFRTGSGSTGLGLSIVRWVAQAHGGSLQVYNADEGGAIFELVLPTAPQPTANFAKRTWS